MKYISIALALLLALAMGCASTIQGKRIDGSKTKDLLAAGTTPADVVKMFGDPQQKETLASGETKYVYYYRVKSPLLWHADSKDQQRLEVFLKGNQVERYYFMDADVQPITTDVPPIQPGTK